MRRFVPLLAVGIVAVACFLLFWETEEPALPPPSAPQPLPVGQTLSQLSSEPDWTSLSPFQDHLTFEDFERQLTEIYTLPKAWEPTINLQYQSAVVSQHHGLDGGSCILNFSADGSPIEPLPPLSSIHIALDPGHIGGRFAEIEQRNFDPEKGKKPVREGDLTLATAFHLKRMLEEMGAKVSLVRERPEPVTTQRPEDFLSNVSDRSFAEKLFYRTAEIRARAQLVNEVLKPDLVLCLHYNAEAWNDPKDPWTSQNHFHILLHGAYMESELRFDDQRFEMVRHLLSRSTLRALPLAQKLSDVFLRETTLTPFQYRDSAAAVRIDQERPIFARNLLANRLYEMPSIYLEPYIMNHREIFERVQLGDYEGFREVNGKMMRSLVREYAEVTAQGVAEYYASRN